MKNLKIDTFKKALRNSIIMTHFKWLLESKDYLKQENFLLDANSNVIATITDRQAMSKIGQVNLSRLCILASKVPVDKVGLIVDAAQHIRVFDET